MANGYQLIRVITVYNDYGICSDNLFDRLLDRFKKSTVVRYPDILYQIDKYFTVCCTTECISVGSERIFQYTVVFNYSVVNHGNSSGLRNMRMSIAFIRLSMRGPSRVCDTDGSRGVFPFNILFQISYSPGTFINIQITVVDQSHTCTV